MIGGRFYKIFFNSKLNRPIISEQEKFRLFRALGLALGFFRSE